MTPAEEIYTRNLAMFKHEAETPMRDHDEDGECCRATVRQALADPEATP